MEEMVTLKYAKLYSRERYKDGKIIGKVQGRREVVEWINKHTIGITADNNLMDNPCWIAQLKEWGLGE